MIVLVVMLLITAIVFLVLWLQEKKKRTTAENRYNTDMSAAAERIRELVKYQQIIDIEAECANIRKQADEYVDTVKRSAQMDMDYARNKLDEASKEAQRIVTEAEEKARDIAGEAYDIKQKSEEYQKAAIAIKNVIDGYGDEWLKPTYSVLDELADDFGFAEAGQELKKARARSASMVSAGEAASCDYVERVRKSTAIHFVVDAFNGKVDSILSKTKKDNYGKLEQQIKDAYSLVNLNGEAFRNARINQDYLEARLEELKWAVVCNELKAQQQEEQRQLREQMREEEKARREYERAQKEAAKEEAMLQKAMEKVRSEMEQASAEQREKFEAELADLQQKLTEAEEKNQRALSMAQQTKHGNVYVISNIGAFGENVYKIGMTRRLEPLDRIRELGDASVPFPFDVHAIIESDDAPSLETSLHKAFALMQMNKVNPRKEFFKVSLSDIKQMVEKMGLTANWTIEAAAAEYRETMAIEEAMKTDPDAKHRWEEYNAALAETSQPEEEIA